MFLAHPLVVRTTPGIPTTGCPIVVATCLSLVVDHLDDVLYGFLFFANYPDLQHLVKVCMAVFHLLKSDGQVATRYA